MKAKVIIIAAFSAVLAASCTVEKMDVSTCNTISEITADLGVTKTSLQAEGKVFWESGDAIHVFCNGKNAKFTSSITAPAASAKFNGTLDVPATGDLDIWAVYPYNSSNSCNSTSVTAVVPSLQTAKAGTFGDGAYVTVGCSKTTKMNFYAVGGGIKFTLNSSNIKSLIFQGNNGEVLAGSVVVKFVDGVPAIQENKVPATSIAFNAPEGETLKAGTEYVLCLAPVNLTKGFNVTFKTADNKTGSMSSTKANEVKRSTISNIGVLDKNVEFKQMSWSAPTVINYNAGSLAFEINPVTQKPELAIVQNVSGSKGPVLYFNDFAATPATVTPAANTTNQYISLGINAAGKAYVFTHNAISTVKKGEIYSSSDKKAWSLEIGSIDATNAYLGSTIGCIGNEVYMMTSNNANGQVGKRYVNVTKFDGASWSTGALLAGRSYYGYFPTMRIANGVMYVLVVNTAAPTGYSFYKYDGSAWTSVMDIKDSEAQYAPFACQLYEHQDMAIGADGQLYCAVGTKTDYGVSCFKIDPDEKTFVQIAPKITAASGNSISARSGRIGINPVTEELYVAYRDNNEFLWVTKLNDETWDSWDAPEMLTSAASGDIEFRFNADGEGYIVCTTGGHMELFTLQPKAAALR